MDHNPRQVTLETADVLRKELKEWHYHQQFDDGICRIFFIKKHAMLCLVVDENSITVNANWNSGCTYDKYCKISSDSIKKATDRIVAKALFIEELNQF